MYSIAKGCNDIDNNKVDKDVAASSLVPVAAARLTVTSCVSSVAVSSPPPPSSPLIITNTKINQHCIYKGSGL